MSEQTNQEAAAKVLHRGRYDKQDVADALERVRNGETYAEVVQTSSVLLRTLFKKAKDQQSGIPIEGMRRGTKPPVAMDLENHLVEWIAAMQCVGLLVVRTEILKRTDLIHTAL